MDAAAAKLEEQGEAGKAAAALMKNEKVKSGLFGGIKNLFGGN